MDPIRTQPRIAVVVILGMLLLAPAACATRQAASAPPATPPTTDPDQTILLTIFLRHDQTKSLAEIQQIQKDQGFYASFPPAGTQVVSWHVVMGIGQVVTLRVPAAKLRDVNVSLERTAWKAFRTEYYATYDLWPVIEGQLTNRERVACATSAPPPPGATSPAPAEPPHAASSTPTSATAPQ